MYRQYENPYTLEEQLEELKNTYSIAESEGADIEVLCDISEQIISLKERINFAWQDMYEEEF